MLKYALVFYIIHSILSFCNSTSRPVGIYNKLVLAVHAPATSFLWQHMNLPNSTVGHREFYSHLIEHGLTYDPQNWVIHGVWPLNYRNEDLKYCRTHVGSSPAYNSSDMDTDFKQLLKTKWPSLKLGTTEDSLWRMEFNEYGSCITVLTRFYFYVAVNLHNKYDVGGILGRLGLSPGRKISLEVLSSALTFSLGSQVYLKCLPSSNPDEQYLLQIQLCFTPLHKLISCEHRRGMRPSVHECAKHRKVIYPEIPRMSI